VEEGNDGMMGLKVSNFFRNIPTFHYSNISIESSVWNKHLSST